MYLQGPDYQTYWDRISDEGDSFSRQMRICDKWGFPLGPAYPIATLGIKFSISDPPPIFRLYIYHFFIACFTSVP